MDLKLIEKLMAAMNRNGMSRLSVKEEGFEIELEKEISGEFIPLQKQPSFIPSPTYGETLPLGEKKEEISADHNALFITSPIVGTFYAAPSPKDTPYVKMGDIVEEETVVCIIEAMKVMNEVKAGLKGVIGDVLVKSGDPVEFGTKIFRIKPVA